MVCAMCPHSSNCRYIKWRTQVAAVNEYKGRLDNQLVPSLHPDLYRRDRASTRQH